MRSQTLQSVILPFLVAASAAATATAQGWSLRNTLTAPAARNSHGMCYDVTRGVAVMFGGYQGTSVALGDLWEWNGFGWVQRIAANAPAARWGHALAFDTRRSRAVMFGGYIPANGFVNETWEWDGASWQQRATANTPGARGYFGMTYDSIRGRSIVFGGTDNSLAMLGDTWEFDGFDWVQSAASGPSGRRGPTITFDDTRGNVVLFGGGDATQAFGDTWTYDGFAWTQRATLTAPSPRQEARIVHDTLCGRAVLHGGADAAFATNYGDSWAWDGTSWTQLAGTSPQGRHGAASAFDAQKGQMVLWGGRDANGFYVDTWQLGSPCSRTMSVVTAPQVGNTAAFRFDYPGAAAGHFYFHLLAGHQQVPYAVPIPGLTSIGLSRVDLFNIYLQPSGLLDASGSNLLNVGIPPDNFLAGLPFDVQTVDFNFVTNTLYWANNDAEVSIAPVIPPVASFTATPTFGQVPLVVQFTDTSTEVGPTSTWQWDFENDGIIDSTHQNPVHTYTAPGVFSVRLLATNVGGSSNTLIGQCITTTPYPPPSARFTATPTYGTAPLVVHFTDTSTNAPTNWQWDFDGDGVVDSTQQHPTYNYTTVGLYSVGLVAANIGGASRVLRSNLIYAGPLTTNPLLNMIPITPGTFQMGSTGVGAAVPVHAVTITQPFWVGKYEVTQAEYQAVCGTNPSLHQGASYNNWPQRPVENVNWGNAMAYCSLLNTAEAAAGRVPAGYQYRLPTEGEWEYVCRAGTATAWNTGASLTTAQANFGSGFFGGGQTTVVGSYPANPWGLFDTHGNVWEWCLDSWDGTANYPSSAVSDPYVSSGLFRVGRGGAWYIGAGECQSAFRMNSFQMYPAGSYGNWGFRVVLAPVLVP